MAFIKAQKIIRDENGVITSGSAAVVDTVYVQTGQKNHSKQVVREKLGRVLFLSDDKKSGIFMSPTRGLVEYNAISDTFEEVSRKDPRIQTEEVFPETEIHTIFGDSYLFIEFLKNSGLISILRTVFQKDEEYERLLCHVLHGVVRDGSRISCENFIFRSFASYLLQKVPLASLKSDTRFFTMMGADKVKVSFFKTFVASMQKRDPDFGKGCYVDSTPFIFRSNDPTDPCPG